MTYASEVLADSPLGFWKLDEATGLAVADSSGNARGMTNAGGSMVINQPGLLADGGRCYDFTNTYCNIASAAWMNVTDLTVEAWINADNVTSYKAVVSRDGGAGARAWNLYVNGGVLNAFNGSADVLATAGSIATGGTYHIVWTYTASGTVNRFYINGAKVGADVIAAQPTSVGNALYLGASLAGTGSASFPFDGRIDNVAVYGTALTAARIAAHYAARVADHADPYGTAVFADGPWAWWRETETAGTGLADASGNNRGSVITGAAHTLNQAGPGAGASRAIAWANVAGKSATEVQQNFAAVAMECWVLLTANPAANTNLMALANLTAAGSTGDFVTLYVDTAGNIRWSVFNGSSSTIPPSGGNLALNTWHHVVGTVGGSTDSAQNRLYLDGVQIGSNGEVGISTLQTKGVYLRGSNTLGNNNTGPVSIAEPALYASGLSTARVAAHYAAMPVGGPTAAYWGRRLNN